MRRLDGVYRLIQHPIVREQGRRFGLIIFILAIIFGAATSSAFPTQTKGETGAASGNRLWSSGAELNSTTADMEVSGTSGTVSISSSTVRSGTYAYRANPTSSTGTFYKTWATAGQANGFFFRTYLRIATAPGATTGVFQIGNGATPVIGVRLTSSSHLQLYNETGTPAQIGSDSSALAGDTWYRVEVKVDNTTSSTTITELRLDGVSVASTSSTNLGSGIGISRLTWGVVTSTTANLFFDDIAINDNSGRTDNWPGEGKIVHIHPNAAGDNSQWTTLSPTNCNASSVNYQCTDEVTPNDATDYINDQTSGHIDDYNIDSASSAGINAGDTIKLVAVNARYERNGGGSIGGGGPGPGAFNNFLMPKAYAQITACPAGGGSQTHYVRLKAAASGTVAESSAITDNQTAAWTTNIDNTAHLPQLTSYALPGTTTKWTAADLDSSQIGVRNGTSLCTYVTAVWLQVEYVPQTGGRIFSSGFELNSATANVEWTSIVGSPTVQTGTVRSGTYAMQTASSGTGSYMAYTFAGTNSGATDDYYFRSYLRIVTLPSSEWDILDLKNSSGTKEAWIRMTTTGTLKLFSTSGGSAQIGSASSALSTNTWYRLEIRFELGSSGTGIVDSRIDGTSFASSTTLTPTTGITQYAIGDNLGLGIASAGQMLYDDVAINLAGNATVQNSWPGDGKIVHLKPNAAGDNSGWTKNGAGCTGGSNYNCVSEVTPDDGTTYNSATGTNIIDDYNVDDPTFGTSDTINVVSVGARFNSSSATEEDFRVRLKDASGGVPIESFDRAPASTTWVTNQTASPYNYALNAYARPEQGSSWTKSDLTSAQIGIRDVNAGTGTAEVSTLWLLVDYTPATETISGTIYQTNESTVLDCSTGGSRTVKAVVAGATGYTSTCSTSAGTYSITGITMSAGDALTVYIDGATEKAATFTVSTGANMTGVDLYQDRAAMRCDNTCSLTNTNINSWDKDNDTDIHATVTGGNLTVDNDWKLLIVNNTFAPGGTVTTANQGSNTYSGDVEIKTGATLNMAGNALSVGGSFTNGGTYTSGSNTTTLAGTSTSATLKSNGSTFNNLTLNNGLLGYWKLDEGTSTTANDSSGNSATGTLVNSPTWTTSIPNSTYYGNDPGGLTLATNQSVTFSAIPLSGDFTIAGWVKVNDTPSNNTSLVTGSTGNINFFAQHVRFFDGAGDIVTAATTTNSGTWYHYIFTRQSDNKLRIYINGNTTPDATSTGTYTSTFNPISIGQSGANATYDDIRIYNRALSSADIASLGTGSHPLGGTYTLQDALTVNATAAVRTGKLDVSSTNYAVSLGGSYANVANFDGRSGTVTTTATSGTQTIQSDPSFNTLTISGSGGTFNLANQRLSGGALNLNNGTFGTGSTCYGGVSCNVTLSGNLTSSGSGWTLNSNASTLTVSGNWDTSSSATDYSNINYSTSTVVMDGTATKTLKTGSTNTFVARFYKLNVGQASGKTTQLLESTGVHNVVSLGAGTIDLNSKSIYLDGSVSSPLSLSPSGTWGTGNGDLISYGGINMNLPAFTYNSNFVDQQNTGFKVIQQGTTTITGNLYFGCCSRNSEYDTNNQTLTVNGNVTWDSSGTPILTAGSSTITVNGNWDNSNSKTFNRGTSTVIMSGSGNKTLHSGNQWFYNLQTGAASGKITQLLANALVVNVFTLGAGTIDLNSNALYDLCNGSSNPNPLSLNPSGTFGTNNGVLVMSSANGSCNQNLPGFTYGSDIAVQMGSGTITVTGAITVTGMLSAGCCTPTSSVPGTVVDFNNQTITAKAVGVNNGAPTFLGRASTINITGSQFGTTWNFTCSGCTAGNGVFTAATSTVNFTNTTTSGTVDPAGNSFYNLSFSGSGGSWSPAGAVTATNDLTMAAGTLGGSQNITVNGNVTGTSGLITLSGGTFTQRVAASKNFDISGGSASWTFSNLTFSDSTGADVTITTQSGTGLITVNGTLSVGAGGDSNATTLDASNRTWIFKLGGASPNPFQLLASPAGVLTASTSIFYFQDAPSSGNTTIQNATYYNLYILSAGKTFVLEGATTANNLVSIGAGTLDTTGSNYALTAATINDQDTLTANASTITLTSTSGTLFTRGLGSAFNQGTSTVAVTSASGTPTLLSGSNTFYNLTINSGAVVTMGATSTVSNNLTLTAGTLADGGSQITGNATGTLSAAASTTLKLGSTGTATTFPTNFTAGHTSLNSASTVVYNAGVSQTISGTPTYGNLQLSTGSGTPTKTLGGATTIAGNLTIDASNTLDTDVSNNYAINLAGSYTNNGTFTARAGTVTLNGTGTQTLTGTMTSSSAFYDLTVTNNSGANPIANEVTGMTASVTFAAAATATHTYTLNAAHIRIQYQTLTTYTFTNISWTGTTGTGNSIYFRSSATTTRWNLNVSGTQSVSYVNVSRSDASSGTTINAANGTNTDSNNNINWSFFNPNTPTGLAQYKSDSTTVIPTGAWTNEATVIFKASISDGDNPATIQLCVEKKAVGVAFSNTEDACGPTVSYTGTPVTASVTISGITDATQYHWQARVKDSGGAYSAWASYGGNTDPSDPDFGVDTTACTTATVYDGTATGVDAAYNTGALDTLSANWDAFNCNVSGLDHYDYSIGTTAGATDVKTWTNNSTTTSVTTAGLNLHTNQHYYFNIRATDGASNTATASSNGQDVLPSLSFGLSANSIIFSNLNAADSWSANDGVKVTTSTNAFGGYVVTQYASGLLSNGTTTVPMFSAGSYASPASWPAGACSGSTCGYGYTSDDTSIQGSNKFNGGTLYAPFSTTAAGDIVADHTAAVNGSTGPVTAEVFTITHKVAVSQLQAASTYQTTIYYIVTGTF